MVLQDNGGDNLTLSANGTFTFATLLAPGATYNVTVHQPQRPDLHRRQRHGHHGHGQRHQRGRHLHHPARRPTYSVGGTLSGLTGSVVLQDNGGDNLTLSANGTFAFATLLAPGATYNVTVGPTPAGKPAPSPTGWARIGAANVTNVAVTCVTRLPGSASDNFNRANGSLASVGRS